VADEQAFREEKISNGRDDGCQQDANAFFALVEKLLERFEGQSEVAGGNGIANIEYAALAGRGHEVADIALAPFLSLEDLRSAFAVRDGEADGAEEAGRVLHDAYRNATGIDAAWFLTAAGAGPSVVME
jgi:hypothetical protein